MQKKKRTTTKKRTTNNKITNRMKLLIALIIMILSFIFIISEDIGIIGNIISSFYFKLLGISSFFIFPFGIVNIILALFHKLDNQKYKILLLYLDICLLFSLLAVLNNTSVNYKNAIDYVLILSSSKKGYGILFTTIGYGIAKLIGKTGMIACIIIISIIILSIYLHINYKQILRSIIQYTIKINTTIKQFIKNIRIQKKKNINIPTKRIKETLSSNQMINEENSNVENPKIFDKTSDVIVNDYIKNTDNTKQISMKDLNINYSEETYYKRPPLELLKDKEYINKIDQKEFFNKAQDIENTLKNFSIDAKVVQIDKGPTVTCYEIQLAPGVKVSRILNLSNDLALSLATSDIRIEAPIPGKSVVGIEVANDQKENVSLKEIVTSTNFQSTGYKMPIALGKDISGNPIVSSIEKMPHLLIAGATGSGKSVCVNTIIVSILYYNNPDDVNLILIDPKVVELSVYNSIPHLGIPVVTDPRKASSALNWAVLEMERRYKIFSENFVRDILSYNIKAKNDNLEKLPYIVIIIDELSDLMMVSANEVEDSICRLAQMARACGIHLIIATQRPTVDVITGTIKANIPSRIAFSVSSQIDSRTILDMAGAETLIGQGDMLFYPTGAMKPKRIQGAFISDKEVENIVKFLKDKNKVQYNDEIIENIETLSELPDTENADELYDEAIEIILQENSASISLLQRKLKIGYSRAGRIIDQLAENNIIGGHEGSKPRKILISRDYLRRKDREDEHSE